MGVAELVGTGIEATGTPPALLFSVTACSEVPELDAEHP